MIRGTYSIEINTRHDGDTLSIIVSEPGLLVKLPIRQNAGCMNNWRKSRQTSDDESKQPNGSPFLVMRVGADVHEAGCYSQGDDLNMIGVNGLSHDIIPVYKKGRAMIDLRKKEKNFTHHGPVKLLQ